MAPALVAWHAVRLSAPREDYVWRRPGGRDGGLQGDRHERSTTPPADEVGHGGGGGLPLPVVPGIPPVPRQRFGAFADDASLPLQPREARDEPPSGRAGQGSMPSEDGEDLEPSVEIRRIAHHLAHTQVRISRILERSLRDLDELAARLETVSEKIRSILRQTEPRRRRD